MATLKPEAVVGFNGAVKGGLLPLSDGEQWIRASGSTIIVGGLSKAETGIGSKLEFLQGHTSSVRLPCHISFHQHYDAWMGQTREQTPCRLFLPIRFQKLSGVLRTEHFGARACQRLAALSGCMPTCHLSPCTALSKSRQASKDALAIQQKCCFRAGTLAAESPLKTAAALPLQNSHLQA